MFKTARPAALVALALTALALAGLLLPPDAYAVALPAKAALAHFHLGDLTLAVPTLLTLRSQESDLVARAAAKMAELTDGLAADAVRAIEGEHTALITELEGVRAQIVEAERAAPVPAPAPVPADPAAAARAAAAERQRQADIRDIGHRSGMTREDIEAALNGGHEVEAFRARAFDFMAGQADRTMTRATAQFGGQDSDDTRRRGMVDAIAARMARSGGDRNAAIPEHARAYGEMGLVEMAAECVGHRGLLRTSRQVTEVFERAFLTTSDFPGIFIDALNVRLLARYRLASPTYRMFSQPYTATDFRPTHVIRAGDFPALQPVGQTGEIKSGSFGESRETFKVDPYGVMVNLARHMIVNDHLGAIDQVLGSVGERVTDWENAKMFDLLKSNPTLITDNKRVFHADHKNLAGSGAAIGILSVGVGRSAMMKQTTIDGLKANFSPKILLVSPDDQTAAEQLFANITPALVGNAVPESFRRLTPVSDANLDGDTAWYQFADPAVAPCFVYGYLEGFEGPRLTSEQVFGVQGMRVKLEHDFGGAAIDFRGAYKNPGVAPTP